MAGVQGLQCWCRLIDVHDGDTCRVGFFSDDGSPRQVILRLDGIDAPEMNSKIDKERAIAARNWVVEWAKEGVVCTEKTITKALANTIVLVFVRIFKADKYGRWLAMVYRDSNPESESVNKALVREGHALPYSGHGKKPYSRFNVSDSG